MAKNMKHFRFIPVLLCLFCFCFASKAQADFQESDPDAVLSANVPVADARTEKLQSYLKAHGSPVADEAQIFINEADKNNLDWKMVAAIAGLESTFCQQIPTGSYNCWGWGIPTGAQYGIGFADFRDGIAQVSQGLRQNYIDRGYITIEQIGSVYAASPTWASRIRCLMKDIDEWNKPLSSTIDLKINI